MNHWKMSKLSAAIVLLLLLSTVPAEAQLIECWHIPDSAEACNDYTYMRVPLAPNDYTQNVWIHVGVYPITGADAVTLYYKESEASTWNTDTGAHECNYSNNDYWGTVIDPDGIAGAGPGDTVQYYVKVTKDGMPDTFIYNGNTKSDVEADAQADPYHFCYSPVCETELIGNGDFETWTDPGGPPDEWSLSGSGITAVREDYVIYEGSHSCHLNWTTTSTRQLEQYTECAVFPGHTYNCKAYIYDNDPRGRVRLYVRWEDETYSFVQNNESEYSEDQDNWQMLTSGDVVAPNDAAYALIQIRCYDVSGSGFPPADVYVDAVSFYEVCAPETPTPEPTYTATPIQTPSNLVNCWHVPLSKEACNADTPMRVPLAPVDETDDVYVHVGVYPTMGADTVTLYYRVQGTMTWTQNAGQWECNYDPSQRDVNDYWYTIIDPDGAGAGEGDTIEYYVKVTKTGVEDTFIYNGNQTSSDEADAQDDPYWFCYPPAMGTELLKNGGFESWTEYGAGGPPDYWNLSDEDITATQEGTIVYEGSYSCHINWTSTSTSELEQVAACPVLEGQWYNLTGYFYDNDDRGKTRFWLRWEDEYYDYIEGAGSSYTVDQDSWQMLTTGDVQAPAGAAYARIQIRVYDETGTTFPPADVYADAISFQEAESIFSPTPVPTMAPTPTETAPINAWHYPKNKEACNDYTYMRDPVGPTNPAVDVYIHVGAYPQTTAIDSYILHYRKVDDAWQTATGEWGCNYNDNDYWYASMNPAAIGAAAGDVIEYYLEVAKDGTIMFIYEDSGWTLDEPTAQADPYSFCYAPECESELLENGDFETWTVPAGPPDGWTVSDDDLTAVMEDTEVHGGTYSCALNWTESGHYLEQMIACPVTPGEEYTLSGFVYDNDPTGSLRLNIRWEEGDNSYISNDFSEYTTDEAAWQELSIIDAEAPADAVWAVIRVRCYVSDKAEKGLLYLDDMTFTQKCPQGEINCWHIPYSMEACDDSTTMRNPFLPENPTAGVDIFAGVYPPAGDETMTLIYRVNEAPIWSSAAGAYQCTYSGNDYYKATGLTASAGDTVEYIIKMTKTGGDYEATYIYNDNELTLDHLVAKADPYTFRYPIECEQELLFNPSFESWTEHGATGPPDDWEVYGDVQAMQENGIVHGGLGSSCHLHWETEGGYKSIQQMVYIPVTQYVVYQLTGYAYDDDTDTDITMKMVWYDATGNFIYYDRTDYSSDQAAWQLLDTGQIVPPSNAVWLEIEIGCYEYGDPWDGAGDIYVDDLHLEELCIDPLINAWHIPDSAEACDDTTTMRFPFAPEDPAVDVWVHVGANPIGGAEAVTLYYRMPEDATWTTNSEGWECNYMNNDYWGTKIDADGIGADLGDTVEYYIKVENTGNTTTYIYADNTITQTEADAQSSPYSFSFPLGCDTQLILNGDMESWSSPTGPPDDWELYGSITAAQEDTIVHGGSYSAHLHWETTSTVRMEQYGIINVTPGIEYEFSAYAYDNDEDGDVRLTIRWEDGDHNYIQNSYSDYSEEIDDWQFLTTGRVEAPDGAVFAQAQFRCYDQGDFTAGDVYVDDALFVHPCPEQVPAAGTFGLFFALTTISALLYRRRRKL